MPQTVAIITCTEFKRHLNKYIDFISTGHNKVYITYRGKTTGVMISPAYYDEMQKTIQIHKEKIEKL